MRIAPWVAGALMATAAVLAGAFALTEPAAYGLCVTCHGRDLLGWTLGWLPGLDLPLSPAAAQAPVLTVVGLLAGAWLGARSGGEVRPRPAGRPWRSFVLGLFSMLFGLLALGCTSRLLLRAAYGDTLAWWALAGVAAGISLATGVLAWRARRDAPW